MSVTPGTRLGPYEILAPLGAGGMGEVYRARDTRLKREVALKVLPQAFATDAERMARFQREAEVLASLNHPNIATIYGVEDRALVMELVDGDSPKGPLPFDEAWKIATQIAAALDYAHERGIVHRDLKPANVKITPDGVVKLLDFGLAKAFTGPTPASGNLENSPTLTLGATQLGVILGTAAYMAPEQAKGKSVDKRADIWSFGVVLYELLTGDRLFAGDDVSETLAQVLTKQPDLERVPAQTRKVLRRCLEKDPRQRLRDIGEARFLLEEPAAVLSTPENHRAATSRRGVLGWALAAVMAVAAGALGFFHFREQAPERQVLRYTIAAPEKSSIQEFAVSPDGHSVVMRTAEGSLSVRSLDSLQTHPLAGTDGATYPFWSPDSRYIGFFVPPGKLKKISVNGGPAQTLCDTPNGGRGGTWNREGIILFGMNSSGISRIPAAGGVPVVVTRTEAGSHRHPVFLPDGRRFLYVSVNGNNNGIYLSSLDSKESRRLEPDDSQPAYFDGHLLFVRDQTLMAQPVEPKTMEATGDLFPLAEQVSSTTSAGQKLYSVSNNGVLIYEAGGVAGGRQHQWFDRSGKQLGAVGNPARSANNFALSPDDKRVAVERLGTNGSTDLWISDLEHSTESRFTFDASRNGFPAWSPDGSKIAFSSTRGTGASSGFSEVGAVANLYQRASNGTGQDEVLLVSKDLKIPWDWSRDGRFLIFSVQTLKSRDLWALPLTGDKKPVPLVQSEFSKTQGQVSPDGKWLAYTSLESAKPEVYVVTFAPGSANPLAGKWQVSTSGGVQPRWRGDAKELFFMAPDGKLMAVDVKMGGRNFEWGTPHALFDSRSDVAGSNAFQWGYMPSANGTRFLIVTTAGDRGAAPPLTVVVNWLAAVKK